MGQPGIEQRRFRQLDAIRGIAALIVVFNHYVQVVPESIRSLSNFPGGVFNYSAWLTPWPWLRFTPLRLIVDGHAAVVVFFLLSGFVLAVPVTALKQPGFLPFIVKRICRIFIPFAAVILLIAFAYSLFPLKADPELSAWFNSCIPAWNDVSVVDHLLMNGKDTRLDPVMWSLIHEMRVSFLFPLVFWTMRNVGAGKIIAFSILVSMGCSIPADISQDGASWQTTGHFLWLFVTGALIAYRRSEIARWLSLISKPLSLALWCGALIMLAIPFDRNWCDFVVGVGAILIVTLSLTKGRAILLLNTSVPLWLGRISYSLYLIHWPILFLVLSYHLMPLWLAFVLTLIAAELSYRMLEAPSHRLGVMLEKRVLHYMDMPGFRHVR